MKLKFTWFVQLDSDIYSVVDVLSVNLPHILHYTSVLLGFQVEL